MNFDPSRSITELASELRGRFADNERMVIDSIASETSLYVKRPSWPGSILVPLRAGFTTRRMQPGSRVVVSREDGDPQRRFVEGGSPHYPWLGDPGSFPVSPGLWHRFGCRAVGRYWSPEEHDLQSGGSVPVEGERTAGHALRASGYDLWWASNAASVGHLDRETGGEPTSTDLGATVLSLWHSGAGPWALVEGDAGNYDTGWSDGYTAGVAAAGPPASYDAIYAGEAACQNETGYDPYGPPYEAREDEDPGTGSGFYLEGYAAGFAEGYRTRWKQLYDYGYAYRGCTVPEEEQ